MNNSNGLEQNSIVKNLMYYPVGPSPLILVKLPHTKCKIIKNNGNKLYCAKYPLIKGLFRKDVDETKKYGRLICDTVAAKFKNFGFFTSDERPKYGISYGISENEYEYIFEKVEASEDEHLVVMFAYDEKEALKSQDFFEKLIRKTYFTYTMEEKTVNMFLGDS